ncbi:uncharacterized protein LOC124169425 [Ischnura elegans]|uniref:uncharacterized protein LOC124169425 n=1 Tax=Ischnura elegans TaxID=197161 RepID=UPI001ED88070|nr:uncharacterized protein LOC124169425 [Ischnura elegans]
MAVRVTEFQKEFLLKFLSENRRLLSTTVDETFTKQDHERLWGELSTALNSMGSGPVKSQSQWKKTWADMKREAREKFARMRYDPTKTAGRIGSNEVLNSIQRRILDLIGSTEMCRPDQVPEIGQFTCKEEEEEENMTVEVPFGSDNIPCLEVAAPNCVLEIDNVTTEMSLPNSRLQDGSPLVDHPEFRYLRKRRYEAATSSSARGGRASGGVGAVLLDDPCDTAGSAQDRLAEVIGRLAEAVERQNDCAETTLALKRRVALAHEKRAEAAMRKACAAERFNCLFEMFSDAMRKKDT